MLGVLLPGTTGGELVLREILLCKVAGGLLAPVSENDRGLIDHLAIGAVIGCKYTVKRNAAFLRKYFALLDVGFSLWEPPDLPEEQYKKYGSPQKNPDKYRGDVLIQTGHYDPVFNLDGTVTLVPKSISFAKMDEVEFERVYSATIDVILRSIPSTYSAEDVRAAADRVVSFV